MNIQIEIRPGEGGADARDLTRLHAALYLRYAALHGLRVSLIEQPG